MIGDPLIRYIHATYERGKRDGARDAARWLEWSDGNYPDDSPGDVIAAYADGTIVLDDGVTTWNPLRACAFLAEQRPQPGERS